MTIESAERRGWGKGWPTCQTNAQRTLTCAGGVRLTARAEILPLLAWLIEETERRGYKIRPADTGAFNCRQIRQTGIPSNHSWGLAIDINWQTNPATTDGRVHTDMPGWMVDLWEAHMFRWGGHYTGSFKDSMHFEFMGTPADAARIITGLHDTADTTGTLTWFQLDPHNPPMRDGSGSLAGRQEVTEVQLILTALGYKPGPVDGIYGDATKAGVVAFKKFQQGMQALTGQPVWPKADASVGAAAIGAMRFWNAHRAG